MSSKKDERGSAGGNWPGPGKMRNPSQHHPIAGSDKKAQPSGQSTKTPSTQGGVNTNGGKGQHQRTKSGSSTDGKATKNGAEKSEKKPEAGKSKPTPAKPAGNPTQMPASKAQKSPTTKSPNTNKAGEKPGPVKTGPVASIPKADTATSKTGKSVAKQEPSQPPKADTSRAGGGKPSDVAAKSGVTPNPPAENARLTSNSPPKDTKPGGDVPDNNIPKSAASETEEKKVGRHPPPIPARNQPGSGSNAKEVGRLQDEPSTTSQPESTKRDTKPLPVPSGQSAAKPEKSSARQLTLVSLDLLAINLRQRLMIQA